MEEITLEERRKRFAEKFVLCQPALSAVGDEMIRTLIEHCGEGGLRVGQIQKNTNISRTAVSHHLKILMEAGIIAVNRRGTMNFYYLDPKSSSLKLVAELWRDAEEMMDVCPEKVKERTERRDEKGGRYAGQCLEGRKTGD